MSDREGYLFGLILSGIHTTDNYPAESRPRRRAMSKSFAWTDC